MSMARTVLVLAACTVLVLFSFSILLYNQKIIYYAKPKKHIRIRIHIYKTEYNHLLLFFYLI